MTGLREALKSALELNGFIAGAYILSLNDFKYLDAVSKKIIGALEAPVTPVVKALDDLAHAADTAELLLRKDYPAEASSLRQKVGAAVIILAAEGGVSERYEK